MSKEQRIETLRTRHAELERRIDQENSRPHPDDISVGQLKKEKLRIKEEINQLGTR